MRGRVWAALDSVCNGTSRRWTEHTLAIVLTNPPQSIATDPYMPCGRAHGRCMTTSTLKPVPHHLDQSVHRPLDAMGFQWLGEALRLVRESTSSEQPLVKERLWDVCSSSDWCSVPSKSALGETLKWLKKQQAVKTKRSAEHGSKKHPRYGYYLPETPAPQTMQPTDEIIQKWARKCHSQDDGHRRALMLSTHASTLAKLVHDTTPGQDPDLQDPWRAERGTPPQSAPVKLPDGQTQITQRLKKLVYVAGMARMKYEYRGKVADTALDVLGRMEDHASKGLKGQLLRDYSSRVTKLRHEMNTRRKECEAVAKQRRAAEAKYQGWLSKVESSEEHKLDTLQPGGRPWWQHVFSETGRDAPAHAVRPEAQMVEVERILEAEEKVADAEWVGSKAEKRAAYMRKVAKSDDERAYAERMIVRAQAETAQAERQAREGLTGAGGGAMARVQQAQKRLRQEAKAWYHQEVAQGELRALERLRQVEKGKQGGTRKPRVSEATAKRAALEGIGHRKELLHRAKKRWQRSGLSVEPYRDPRREPRVPRSVSV